MHSAQHCGLVLHARQAAQRLHEAVQGGLLVDRDARKLLPGLPHTRDLAHR